MKIKILLVSLFFFACNANNNSTSDSNSASSPDNKTDSTTSFEAVTKESNFSKAIEEAAKNKDILNNLNFILHLKDSIYTEKKLMTGAKSDLPPGLAVTVYSDRDFQGASQKVGYIGDLCWREESITLPRSSLSSLKVPFGLTATLYGRWDCLNKLGDFFPEDIPYVGEDRNDKTRSIKVFNKSIFFTAIRGEGSGSIFNINKRYQIPKGYTVQWQEATKAGNADWKAWIANDSFNIRINVRGPGVFGPASWCGVDVWLVKK